MMDIIFILLLICAVIFMILASQADNQLWAFIYILLATLLWFILAASVMEIEIPYQMYNQTTGYIEAGSHIFTGKVSPYLVYLFIGLGVISMIVSILMIVDIVREALIGVKQ